MMASDRVLARALGRGRPGPIGIPPLPVWSGDVNLSFVDDNGDPYGPPPKNLLGPEGPAGDFRNFETRTRAIASIILPMLTSIRIQRYADGFPLAYAVYIPGTSAGPMAFQEAGGNWWQLDLSGGLANIFWFGVAGDGRVEHTPINAAITMLAAAGGGRMYFPRPPLHYHIASPIQGKPNVSFSGDGGLASKILCDNCNGIELNFSTSYGKVIIEDLYFEGVNGAASQLHAIKVPGTLDDADELYGVTISRNQIRYFYGAMHFRATRNLTISDNWGESLNSGIELIGKDLVVNIIGNRLVRGDGYGSLGDVVGIDVEYFDFTDGAGIVPCEGVEIHYNLIFGFAYCLRAGLCNSLNFENNNIDATLYGVSLGAVQGMCSVQKNDIEMQSSAAVAGIYLTAQSAVISAKFNLKNNHITGTPTVAGVSGIVVEDKQHNFTIEGNMIEHMDGYDINVNSPGKGRIHDNLCLSTAATSAIRVDTRQVEVITITENNCMQPIEIVSASDLKNRYVIREDNIVNGVLQPPYLLTNAGSPQGVVVSGYAGQDCQDTANNKWYRATLPAVNNSWVALN